MAKLLYLLLAAAGLGSTAALKLNPSSQTSIHRTLSEIAQGIFGYYNNSAVGPGTKKWQVGLFPYPPYFWWESGAVWGAMVDYWSYTGDSTYLNMTLDALAAQIGPRYNYIMPQQSFNEGNDDQEFWTYAVLAAMEQGLPPLPCSKGNTSSCPPSYLEIAEKIFDELTQRWKIDSNSCHGGLRWQYNSSLNGWTYKNSITNSGFFQIAARLARYTGKVKYVHWAAKIWNWEKRVGLITHNYHVIDGASVDDNCTTLTTLQWSYNLAVPLYGAAVMYNYTGGGPIWRYRVQSLLNTAQHVFFSPFKNATNVMYESECEKAEACNTDEQSFKAYLSRFLGKAALVAPFAQPQIQRLMKTTAVAAARSCTGSGSGTECGSRWYVGGFNGESGLGELLSALEAVQSLLARPAIASSTSRL